MNAVRAGQGDVLLPLALAALLASCGSPDGAAGSSWTSEGASFGVDRATWPGDMDSARDLITGMPDQLEGGERDDVGAEADVDDAWAGLSYSEGRTSLVVSDGRFEGALASESESDAQGKLAAMFGLVFGCEVDTYEGSIEIQGDGPGLRDVDPETPAWFACRIDGAEGDDGFTGHAAGWTSTTEVAWLVVADDEPSVRAMVEAMHEAAR